MSFRRFFITSWLFLSSTKEENSNQLILTDFMHQLANIRYHIFPLAITHVKTTKMAIIYPSVGISPTHTPREPEGNFLRNANETTDNKGRFVLNRTREKNDLDQSERLLIFSIQAN